MPFTAEAELTLDAPIEAVFSQFIDYPKWTHWMPATFRPMGGPSRSLAPGDRLLVNVTGVPSRLRVERVDPPTEVCWSGGLPGLLVARHSFFFESVGGATRIRSVEPWTGLLSNVGIVARRIQRTAERVGLAQLQGFESWFMRERRVSPNGAAAVS
jgi:hypothetical protein